MPAFPSAIIFVNNDLTQSVQNTLSTQLFLNDVMTGAEFDARVAEDPNYPTDVHLNFMRILVIRNLSDYTNRNLADFVIFIKAGMAQVLVCNHGNDPPGLTLPVAYLTIFELIRALSVPGCCSTCQCHGACSCKPRCLVCFNGIPPHHHRFFVASPFSSPCIRCGSVPCNCGSDGYLASFGCITPSGVFLCDCGPPKSIL